MAVKDMFAKRPRKPVEPPVKVTVTFEMDEKTAKLFLQSSIERVINTSISIIENVDGENVDINLEDWNEWKPVVCSMWNAIHDAVFRVKSGIPPSERSFTLRKGD